MIMKKKKGYFINEEGFISSQFTEEETGADNFIESEEMPWVQGMSIKANASRTGLEYVPIVDAQPTLEEKQLLLVAKRNDLLNRSDKYLVSDFPIDEADRGKIIEWRAGLYRMEQSDSFINEGEFEFPEKPAREL
jgi:hypothetical protein